MNSLSFCCNQHSLHSSCSAIEGLGLDKGSACFCAAHFVCVCVFKRPEPWIAQNSTFLCAFRVLVYRNPSFSLHSFWKDQRCPGFSQLTFEEIRIFLGCCKAVHWLSSTPFFSGLSVHWFTKPPCLPGPSVYYCSNIPPFPGLSMHFAATPENNTENPAKELQIQKFILEARHRNLFWKPTRRITDTEIYSRSLPEKLQLQNWILLWIQK